MVNSTREEAAVYAADGYARERGLGAAAVTFGVGALAGAAALGGSNAERVPVVLIAGAPGPGRAGRPPAAPHPGRRHRRPPPRARPGRRRDPRAGRPGDGPRGPRVRARPLRRTTTARCTWSCRATCSTSARPRAGAGRPRPAAPRAPSGSPPASPTSATASSAARRPVVWSGVGILRRGRGAKVLALAERLGAPVVESVMGKGGVDERHPLVVGVYSGASSDDAVRRMVERADLVLELGVDINDINTGAFTLGVRRGAPHPGRPHRPAGGLPRLPGRDPRRPRSTASSGARCAAGGRRPGCRAPGPGAAARGRASPATSSPSGSRSSCARRTSSSATSGWPPTC